MARLNANTVVLNGYEPVSLAAGDEVPEWALDQVGDHLLEEPSETDQVGDHLLEEPSETEPVKSRSRG